jgi:hypothetical protein
MASAKAIVEMLMEGLAQGRSSKGLPEPTVTGRKVSCMGVNCPITMENLWNIIILKLFEESIDGLFSIAMLRQPEGRKWVNKNEVNIYIYGIYLSLYIYIYSIWDYMSDIWIVRIMNHGSDSWTHVQDSCGLQMRRCLCETPVLVDD